MANRGPGAKVAGIGSMPEAAAAAGMQSQRQPGLRFEENTGLRTFQAQASLMTVREILREIGELSTDERRELFPCLADIAAGEASIKYVDREEVARAAEKILTEHEELFRRLAAYEAANSAS